MGAAPVLIAFVATIIGGLGSLYAAVFGGFFLGALSVLLQVYPARRPRSVPRRVRLRGVIAVLLIRPQGLIVVRGGWSGCERGARAQPGHAAAWPALSLA